MTALFTIDCHACGAKNTIDTETMRRVDESRPGACRMKAGIVVLLLWILIAYQIGVALGAFDQAVSR